MTDVKIEDKQEVDRFLDEGRDKAVELWAGVLIVRQLKRAGMHDVAEVISQGMRRGMGG